MTLPTILIDTREQNPYEFKGFKTLRRGLKYGDYSLQGKTATVVIERKSLADLYGTLARKHNFTRFCKELEGLKKVKYAFLLVEATPERVMAGFSYSMANGPLVLDKIMRLYCQYGVQIVFGGSRYGAERVALSILKAACSIEIQKK